jgi:ligand-binding sensor domain-containing protein/signal transduction histidine kinase/DNA-binding response OmpR family regulator
MIILDKWKIIVLIMLICSITEGQTNYVFQNLTKKDGLSQASVFSITQDNSGFMWFGTREGLNKFDGYQFKIYKDNSQDNSIVSNDIRSLYYNKKDGELWIGTLGGLSKYQSSTDDFINYSNDPDDPNSISNNVIRKVLKDSKGRLWIGTSIGLNILDEESNTFTRYYLDNSRALSNEYNDVKAILEDKDGVLWFGTSNGLYKLNTDENGSFFFKKNEFGKGNYLSNNHIKNILEDVSGNFWIGTFEGGLNYWNKKEGTIKSYVNEKNNPNSLSHNNIRSLCFDKDENLWIGTFDGLNYLEKDATSFKRFTKSSANRPGLSDKSIRSLYADKRGSLWVGTYYGGINHLDENYNRFRNRKHSLIGNGLKGNVVSSFTEDKDKNLWIGTEGDGLNFYDKKNNRLQNFKYSSTIQNSLSGNNVKELLLDGDRLWIGTFQAGLNVYDLKNKVFKVYKKDVNNSNSLSANNVYNLLREDNLLWILTYGGGLDILDLATDRFYNYAHIIDDSKSLSSDLTRVILKTKSGQLWIGTDNGLNKVARNEENFPASFDTFLSNEKIYALTEDSQGHIWIGTFSNGFYQMDPTKNVLKHFTTSEGLPGNTVFGIIEVSSDELWISTNNGLSKFDPVEKSFTNYDYSNGLENTEYNFNAYYKDSEGDLLFGGLNGFTYFNPRAIKPNEFIPPVVFTDLRKNNLIVNVGDESGLLEKSINETELIKFNYNEANFSIDFAALDYFSPGSNQYAFMLEGIDKEWKYSVGKTAATYTIQRSGDYTFRLKGGNSEGLWNSEERALKIKVLPPPWKTWWAYLIYSLILASIIIGTYRFVKLRHNLQVEKIINQQQGELHEVKLRFFTNITHEFRTPLTLIIAPLNDVLTKENLSINISNQLKTVERNAQRMLNLVNQILTFRKLATDHSELNIVKGNIVFFLQEIFLLFQNSANRKNINYIFETENEIIDIWFDQDKLEKVFYNLLSNAFKFTPNNENIKIKITEPKGVVEIKVSDSGLGIEPEYRDQIFKRFYEKSNEQSSTIKGSGIGLAISKQMVELHQGEIFLADKKENPFSRGATFIIRLPKGKKHFNNKDLNEKVRNGDQLTDYYPVITENGSTEKVGSTPLSEIVKEAPKILVVEDNYEVREYVKNIFIPHYEVITAKNGREGLEKIRAKLPDLVISDIMMPEKDGISLCKELKSDFEISHIPVVLLTARAASLFKIEGLEIGADDYVTKPFNPEELRLRVRNILNARKKVKAKFKRVMTFDPEEITITSADEVFLEKAVLIVEKQIGNYDFNVNQFAFELAVSRPLLFTKLKALTGQTPNNFIKSIRMKRAAQLLKAQKLNISEVAYRIGFKDVKYFRKCFKDQFKMTPSDFKKNASVSH